MDAIQKIGYGAVRFKVYVVCCTREIHFYPSAPYILDLLVKSKVKYFSFKSYVHARHMCKWCTLPGGRESFHPTYCKSMYPWELNTPKFHTVYFFRYKYDGVEGVMKTIQSYSGRDDY